MGAEVWGGEFTAGPSESVPWSGGLGSGMRGLCWFCGQSLLEWGLGAGGCASLWVILQSVSGCPSGRWGSWSFLGVTPRLRGTWHWSQRSAWVNPARSCDPRRVPEEGSFLGMGSVDWSGR